MTEKVLALVTGASRGFGLSICEEFSKTNKNIDFVLFAFSFNDEKIQKITSDLKSFNPNVNILHVVNIDMSVISQVEKEFQSLLDKINMDNYTDVVFVNNHGSLSTLDLVENLSEFKQIESDITLNTTSIVVTSSLFLRKIKSLTNFKDIRFSLVNVSSLCAIKPFQSWGIYCCGKAFRDMLYQNIAVENPFENLKTLNYAPGPMDTDMQKEIREKCTHGPTKQVFIDMKEGGRLVNPNTSAAKLVKLVFDYKFTSGAHLDFFDQ
ncbi:hypothetical protein CYY_004733 [Polysphondylium violaceum]|uniref:Sepiapterin reductase n=1 Tax=Polysphondylium violaceum TaxID=133409 RepID=A0A8J4Q4T2_9MYCE|nr:hypothetical protein CYY_004733 [Polysphondylium violaceum]